MARSGPETRIGHAIMLALRQRGCMVWKHHATEVTGRGWPDLQGVLPGGRAIMLETKTPVGRAEPLQVRRIEQLRSLGAAAGFVTSVDDALRVCGLD